MISSEAASLGVSIASGVLKLAGRVDRIRAEKQAVQGELVLPMPPVSGLPPRASMESQLRKLLASTKDRQPDPVADRATIQALLDSGTATRADYEPHYRRLFPDRLQPKIDPDAEFIRELRKAKPTWNLDDEETRLAAFYVTSGSDDRKKGYSWRLALTVVDAVSEFGAENTALFVRDENLRQVAQSVLARFAETDLDTFDSWGGLLRFTLSATLNGAVDARQSLDGNSEWLDSVLDALANARETVDDPDNYIMGLLRGRGYQLLIGATLDEAATKLDSDGADAFRDIGSDLLKTAAPLVKQNRNGFRAFFQEHWGDLLRAGFKALEAHGPTLLKEDSPLLRDSLLAVAGQLAKTRNSAFLSRETLFGLVDTVVATVVSNPDLTAKIDEPWLKELVTSVAGVLAKSGARATFSKDNIETLVRGALTTLAEHPELIAKEPGLVQDIVGSVLDRLSQVGGFGLQDLASAAVEGALSAVATDPNLLDGKYTRVLASFAGLVAEQVRDRKLSKIQGRDLLKAFSTAVLKNPQLFLNLEDKLAESVVQALLRATQDDQAKLVAGHKLVLLARKILAALAAHGRHLIENLDIGNVVDALTNVLTAGLTRAAAEVGLRIDRESVPAVIAELIAAWLRGEIAIVDPNNPAFKSLFSTLADEATASGGARP